MQFHWKRGKKHRLWLIFYESVNHFARDCLSGLNSLRQYLLMPSQNFQNIRLVSVLFTEVYWKMLREAGYLNLVDDFTCYASQGSSKPYVCVSQQIFVQTFVSKHDPWICMTHKIVFFVCHWKALFTEESTRPDLHLGNSMFFLVTAESNMPYYVWVHQGALVFRVGLDSGTVVPLSLDFIIVWIGARKLL